jgi:hypothetical protein
MYAVVDPLKRGLPAQLLGDAAQRAFY